MVKRKRNPVLSGILTAVFTAAGILFLTVIVSLFLDEKRAGSLVKKLYPAAELLDTMPTSQILRSDVACLLYPRRKIFATGLEKFSKVVERANSVCQSSRRVQAVAPPNTYRLPRLDSTRSKF